MRRQTIEVRAKSPAGVEAVFAVVRDRSTWPSFSKIRSFELERAGAGAAPGGVGEIAVFRQWPFKVREEIVEVVDDCRLRYVLRSGNVPVRDYRSEVEVEPDGDGTALRWTASFLPVVPGTGWLLRRIIEASEVVLANGLVARAAEQREQREQRKVP